MSRQNLPLASGGFLADDAVGAVPLGALQERRIALLLGEPGSGKSTAMREMYRTLSAFSGMRVTLLELSEIATLSELQRRLSEITDGSPGEAGTLLLDGIDEIRGVQRVVPFVRQIVDRCLAAGWRLIATSRTAETLPAIPEIFEEAESGAVHALLPLRRQDAEALVRYNGVSNPEELLVAVSEAGLDELASNPLTLELVAQAFKANGILPVGAQAVLDSAVTRLLLRAARPDDSSSPVPQHSVAVLRKAAERLAAYMALTGATGAALTSPGMEVNGFETERAAGTETIDNAPREVTNAHLQAALLTPLFVDAGSGERHFAHRRIRDFLAAAALTRWPLERQQLTSLLTTSSGGKSSIPPQTLDIATALVASSTLHDWLVSVDPLNLARNQLGRLRPDLAQDLVAGLIENAKEVDYLLGWADELRGLAHPHLESQLRPHLQSDSAPSMFVALRVLGDSYVPDLQAEVLSIARDIKAPVRCRVQAVRVLAENGASADVLGLPFMDPDFFEGDVHCELRGRILEVLYPDCIPISDVLDLLVPEPNSFFGIYAYFISQLSHDLSGDVAGSILRWWSGGPEAFAPNTSDDESRFGISRLLDAACGDWLAEGDDDVETYRALVRVLMPHFEAYSQKLPVSRSRTEDDRWHELLYRVVQESPEVAERLAWFRDSDGVPFVQPRDVRWLALLALKEPIAADSIWSRLMLRVLSTSPPDLLSIVWSYRSTPLWTILARRFVVVDLASPEVAEERRDWAQLQQAQQRQPAVLPIAPERFLQHVQELAARARQHPEAFWTLARLLDVDLNTRMYAARDRPDLFASESAEMLDDALREEILLLAARYLEVAELALPKRRKKDTMYFSEEALFRAAYTLEVRSPGFLEPGSKVAWGPLARVALNYETYGDDQEEVATVRGRLLALIQEASPLAFQQVVSKFLTSVARGSHVPSAFRELDASMIGGFVRQIQRLVRTATAGTRDAFWQLLSQIDPDRSIALASKVGRTSVDVSAVASSFAVLYDIAPERFIRIVQKRAVDVPDIIKDVLLKMASTVRYRRPTGQLNEAQKGHLYELLVSFFPPESAEIPLGVHGVTPREELARWRDAQLDDLVREGTDDSLQVLKRLAKRHTAIGWAVVMAFEAFRQSSWRPPSVGEINLLLARPETRLINSSDELLHEVLGALGVIQGWLIEETPQSFALWNRLGSDAVPKDEGRISDWYCHALRTELGATGVLIYREVEVRNRLGKGVGERNDIRVGVRDSVRDRDYEVVIEVKGIWNSEVRTHLVEQLAGKYLLENGLTHGVYLVAAFNPRDITDKAKARTAASNAKGLLRHLARQAAECRPELQIEPVVHRVILG